MTHADHSYLDCPDLHPVLPWIPLLRRLHAAGWEHGTTSDGYSRLEHHWWRNRHAVNAQQINWNLSGASVVIGDRTVTDTHPAPADADLLLALLGAYEPAPPRINRPETPVQRHVRDALLTMAANDPQVDDDTFAVIAQAVEGRL